MEITHHQAENSINEIRNIAETAGLGSVAEDRKRLTSQRLTDEGRDDASVIKAHARTVSIENTNDVRVHAVIAVVGHGNGFREALGLIVNPAWPDGVHIAPVVFGLWMNERIAVALGSRG